MLTTLPQSNDEDLKKTIEQRLSRGSVFTGSGQIVTVDLGWVITVTETVKNTDLYLKTQKVDLSLRSVLNVALNQDDGSIERWCFYYGVGI